MLCLLQNSIGGMLRTEFAERKRETSVQPLKRPTANGNTYSRAGTAELKPRAVKKLEYTLFLRHFFIFTERKWH